MTTGGHEQCPGAPWPHDGCPHDGCRHDECPHDEWSADLAADDALLDGIAAGRAVEEPVVGDLHEDVERELAVTLLAWRRSVRRHPETWSVDVDRAAVLVTRARATSHRPRRLLPGTSVAAAAVAGLVVVILWGTPSPLPGPRDEVALATSADLDHASEALERGDMSEARIALSRAENRLAAESEESTATQLRARFRALHDEVDAGTSRPSRPEGPQARSAPRSEVAGHTPRRSSRARSSSGGASDRATADEPSTARSRAERPTTEGPTTGGPTTERPTTERPTTERPTTERPTTERPREERPQEERPREERPEQSVPSRGTPSAPVIDSDDPLARPGDDDEPSMPGVTRPGQDTTGPSITDRDSTDRDSTDRHSTDRHRTEPFEAEAHDREEDEDDEEDEEDEEDEDD